MKADRMLALENNRAKKESKEKKRLVSHERALKSDAFNRVDELQAQLTYKR